MVLRVAFVAAVAFGLARDCGAQDNPPSGPNAPCTRTKDCSAGLVCTAGVCEDPDASTAPIDAAVPDAPADAPDDGG